MTTFTLILGMTIAITGYPTREACMNAVKTIGHKLCVETPANATVHVVPKQE